jgi:hypothetical protein
MTDLPRAVNTEQLFLAHQCEQLDRLADAIGEQNELLRQVLTARQAGPAEPERPAAAEPADSGPVAVKLREPEPPTTSKSAPEPAELREPAPEPKPTRPARGGRRSTKAST